MAKLGAAWKPHARKLRRIGWSWAQIEEHVTRFYGRAISQKQIRWLCRDIAKGTATDKPRQETVYDYQQVGEYNGEYRKLIQAERWLQANDPDYAKHYSGWRVPKGDALCRTVATTEAGQQHLHNSRSLRGTESDEDGADEEQQQGASRRIVESNARAWDDWSYRPNWQGSDIEE